MTATPFNPYEYGPPAVAMIAAALTGDSYAAAKIITRWDGTLLAQVMAQAAASLLLDACRGDPNIAMDLTDRRLTIAVRSRARQITGP